MTLSVVHESFAALAVNVDSPSRMRIVLPGEIEPLRDKDGNEAYIDFLAGDSEAGRAFERQRTREITRRAMTHRDPADLAKEAESEDPAEDQVERLVALAVGWHLVAPDRNVINVPFSKDNARALFSAHAMGWLRRRAFAFVVNEANFMQRSASSS